METIVYHNPRCSKSRATLALLEKNGIEPTVVEYLKTPPDGKTLRRLLKQLGMKPRELMRTGEKVYRELGLDWNRLSDAELIAAMVDHPILIERPIVVRGEHARIGRPPENVLGLL